MDVQLIVLTRMASQQSSSDTVEPRHTMASIRAIEATHQKELERLNTTILSKRQRLTQRIEQDHMVQQKQLEEDLGALEQDMTDISDAWHEEKEKLEGVNKACAHMAPCTWSRATNLHMTRQVDKNTCT